MTEIDESVVAGSGILRLAAGVAFSTNADGPTTDGPGVGAGATTDSEPHAAQTNNKVTTAAPTSCMAGFLITVVYPASTNSLITYTDAKKSRNVPLIQCY